jgi:hypothetical protein
MLAAALLQAAPSTVAAAPAPGSLEAAQAPRDNGLPKDDYGLVAWCHGALAGQLDLDPIAHKDMEQIEGKAKVAARAKEDAEMVKERRVYLKDYEHALAAAEAASPVAIHQQGVDAELRGFRMWNETRNKAPIWRMLDWGMWDPNDAGCNDAAKRLYAKSSLFGEALKGSAGDSKADAPAAPLAAPEPTAAASATRPTNNVEADTPVETATPAPAPTTTAKAAPKKPKANVAKAKPADSSAEAIREAIAKGKAETEASAPAATPAATPPAAGPGLRGPQ